MLSGDEFAAVLKSRARIRSAHFSLHWLIVGGMAGRVSAAGSAGDSQSTGTVPVVRLGLVVSKKLARTSVRRNLIKRQSRMLVRVWAGSSVAACDVVLKLTANVAKLDRRAQFCELAGLMQALPRARHV